MEGGKRQEFPHYFSSGKKLFQDWYVFIPTRLTLFPSLFSTDPRLPGSSDILATSVDDTAILSAFVESLSADESAEKLEASVSSASAGSISTSHHGRRQGSSQG